MNASVHRLDANRVHFVEEVFRSVDNLDAVAAKLFGIPRHALWGEIGDAGPPSDHATPFDILILGAIYVIPPLRERDDVRGIEVDHPNAHHLGLSCEGDSWGSVSTGF